MKKSLFVGLGVLLMLSACTTAPVTSNNSSTSTNPTPTPIPAPTQQTQQPVVSQESGTKTYKDDSGFSFDYPSSLSVNKVGDKVVAMHTVPFQHSPPCDFVGNGKELTELTDFNVSLEVYKKSLKETVTETQDENFVHDNMVGDTMKVSEGFIDAYTAGSLKGYKLTLGVEGCGQYVYYFPLKNDTETLVVVRAFVPELNSAISDEMRTKAEKLPGVILPKENENIFSDLLNSFAQ